MAQTSDEVRHVALLARVGLTPEEVELYRSQLDNVLNQFQLPELSGAHSAQEMNELKVQATQAVQQKEHQLLSQRQEVLHAQAVAMGMEASLSRSNLDAQQATSAAAHFYQEGQRAAEEIQRLKFECDRIQSAADAKAQLDDQKMRDIA